MIFRIKREPIAWLRGGFIHLATRLLPLQAHGFHGAISLINPHKDGGGTHWYVRSLYEGGDQILTVLSPRWRNWVPQSWVCCASMEASFVLPVSLDAN